jgi:REP element-mobilizing transposase RayT
LHRLPACAVFSDFQEEPAPLARAGKVYFITALSARAILDSEDRTMVMDTLRHWDGLEWKIFAAVILIDHVHVLAQSLS